MTTYAVFVGRQPGLYNDWSECSQQVIGYSGAIYKRYKTYEAAETAFLEFWGQSNNFEGTSDFAPNQCIGAERSVSSSTSHSFNHQQPNPHGSGARDLAQTRPDTNSIIILLGLICLILSLKILFT